MDVLAELELRLDRRLDELSQRAASGQAPVPPAAPPMDHATAMGLLEDMVASRVLDVVARELRAESRGFYTIGSSGHELNAVLGAVTRPTDPALLHYRSGGFMLARARRAAAEGLHTGDPILDTVRSLLADRDDPASGGRHKVWGSAALAVPPQTSTIASHLPKAVGLAIALARPRGPLGTGPGPGLAARPSATALAPAPLAAVRGEDPIVVCSFGDASFNHATAQAAFNAARWARRRGSAVPVLFVCEDNGIGISVPTPDGWIAESVRGMDGIEYHAADGHLDEVFAAAAEAVDRTRRGRAPVFLHLRTVRLGGHAGSDPELAYRDRSSVERDMARDPVLLAVERVVATGLSGVEECRRSVADVRGRVRAASAVDGMSGPLASADDVMAPLAPYRPDAIVLRTAELVLPEDVRRSVSARRLPEEVTQPGDRTLAARINQALREELARRPGAVLFGEDVGRRGGVYGVTAGLQETFGIARVHDTLLDETSILGLAQGYGLAGGLPIPEIQYLAYVHNALDQLRGEACSTSFFSSGRFTTPMVVRIAGLAYQRGFGGHFHNDDSIGALRDIPGLLLAVPSRGDDAVRMLRAALAMAEVDGRVVAFLEPIALYHERDLHAPGDGGWLTDFPVATGGADDLLLPGQVGLHGDADADTLIVTYGNGVRMSLRASARWSERTGRSARVLDLRWLNPLPLEEVRSAAAESRRVLVVDECRATGGGIADAVIADLAEHGAVPGGGVRSVRSLDSYVPIGPAADLVLVGEDDILRALA